MLSLIITLVVLGIIWYLVGMIPMDGRIKTVVNILFIVLAIWILLGAIGVGPGIGLGRLNL